MYNNSDFFNDDLNFILTLSKEEYRYNDLLFNKMKKVMDNVRNMKGINKNIALEANRVYDDLNIRVNRLTDEISTVGYSAAMEEMSKGMMALIAAGIAAFIAMIWKIIGVLTDGDGGSTSGYGGGGGVSIQDKIKTEEVNSELLKEAVNSTIVISEKKDQVINTISNEAKKTSEFANEINSHNNNNNNIDNYINELDKAMPEYEETIVDKFVDYLAFIKSHTGNLLDENNRFNQEFSNIPNVIRFIKVKYTELSNLENEVDYAKKLNDAIEESGFKNYFSMEDKIKTNSYVFDYLNSVLDKIKEDPATNVKEIKLFLTNKLGANSTNTSKVEFMCNYFINEKIFDDYLHVKTYILKSSEKFSVLANELDELLKDIRSEGNKNDSGTELRVIGSQIHSFVSKVRELVMATSRYLLSLQNSMETIEWVVSENIKGMKKSVDYIVATRNRISISTDIDDSVRQAMLSKIDELSNISDAALKSLKDISSKVSSTELKESGAKKFRLVKTVQKIK